jgi:hypothetical protein
VFLSAVALWLSVQPAAIDVERTQVRLVQWENEVQPPGEQPPPPPGYAPQQPYPPQYGPPPLELQRLQLERQRLLDERPGIVLPIILMAGGAGAAAYGTLFLISLLGSRITGFNTLVLIIGIGAVVIGLAVAALGVFFLIKRLGQRKEIDAKVGEIDARLGAYGLQRRSEWQGPAPALQLASF